MSASTQVPSIVWIGEALGGFVAALSLIWSIWKNRSQRRQQQRQDTIDGAVQATHVAFEGFEDLLNQLRAEIQRRDDREQELIKEIATLRAEVSALRAALVSNNIPIPLGSA